MQTQRYSGTSVRRVEDRRLITGNGRYVDDLAPANVAHAAIVRSPFAHARIRGIDVEAARAVPGVIAVLTAADVLPHVHAPFPVIEAGVSNPRQSPPQYPIARDEAVYEGEPLAVVVAETRYAAADAAALVELDLEALPAVVDLDAALEPGAPTVHEGAPDNVAWDVVYPGTGDIDAAFAEAAVVVSRADPAAARGGGPDGGAGRARRLRRLRRRADAVDRQPDAALHPDVRRRGPGHPREQAAGHLARRRRRVRRQDGPLRRGIPAAGRVQAHRPPGEVVGDPQREPRGDQPRPRARLRRRGRRRGRRHPARAAGPAAHRRRRLHRPGWRQRRHRDLPGRWLLRVGGDRGPRRRAS